MTFSRLTTLPEPGLPAILSQALVAFNLELGNVFIYPTPRELLNAPRLPG
jgi:hypothetical protein